MFKRKYLRTVFDKTKGIKTGKKNNKNNDKLKQNANQQQLNK